MNASVLQMQSGMSEDERLQQTRWDEKRQILRARMEHATRMEQWQNAAKELDVHEDNEAWKQDAGSGEFDVHLVETRLRQLDEARINCDVRAMMHLVRQALARDLGGMGNIRLYKHSHIGTKDLIERYIDSTLDTIRSLVETSRHALPDGLETKDILEQVVYARQAFGRSALLLSGGATFGMNHVGVLKALFESKLLPRIISGTSAGSIVCAVLCTRTDEEVPDLLRSFPYGDLSVFEDNEREDSILERVRRLLTQGAWIDIKHLMRVMRNMLGDMTFQEAYNRTRRILNITVSSASVYELPRLLNYVTAPNVMIWSAVAASCSVPVLFSAAQLLVKNPATGEHAPWNPTPQLWIDGSVDNDLPMTRLAEMFNVNHFIVSQVNPHVVPFLIKDDEAITKDVQSKTDAGPGWIYTLTNLAKDEALHRMHVLTELGIFPNLVGKARSVLSQKYSGDITILPQIDYKDFPRILKNPTSDFMEQACLCGERATWPKLSRIKNHCAVELELDAAVQALRARVVFSPSQVDLRRMTTGSDVASRNTRRRRDSGSALHPFRSIDETNNTGLNAINARPVLRTGKSHAILSTRAIGLKAAQLSNLAINDSSAEHVSFDNLASNRSPRKDLIAFPDFNFISVDNSLPSPPSSDADIDSHTDDSGPETELTISIPQSSGGTVDYFSSSQPVTTGTDRLLATSPSATRDRFGLSITTGRLDEPES